MIILLATVATMVGLLNMRKSVYDMSPLAPLITIIGILVLISQFAK